VRRTDPTPVLVLGGGLTVLGVIRTLGRAGIPAFVVNQRRDVVRTSRWYRPAPPTRTGVAPHDGLARLLDDLPLERAVILPCSDHWTLQAARLDPCVTARFPTGMPAAPAVETFLDKGRFAAALADAAVPHPFTAMVGAPLDPATVPRGPSAGFFLKPRDSEGFFRRFGVKAFRLATPDEALERASALGCADRPMMIQEYIPGPASNHYFVDGFIAPDGSLAAAFARRRVRMYPSDFGNSTCQISVPAAEVRDATAGLERLTARVGYRGIFSAEFKRDDRDGLFKILEVNVRPWWYVEFAARSGVDVCSLAYRSALGLPIEPVHQVRVGRRCVYAYYDFARCRELLIRRELTVREWARSWLGADFPLFRLSDPLPGAVEAATLLWQHLRKRVTETPR
jgi:D-aspartate ligase